MGDHSVMQVLQTFEKLKCDVLCLSLAKMVPSMSRDVGEKVTTSRELKHDI